MGCCAKNRFGAPVLAVRVFSVEPSGVNQPGQSTATPRALVVLPEKTVFARVVGVGRAMVRLVAWTACMMVSYADFWLSVRLAGRAGSALARARWAQRWSRRYLRVLRIEVTREGVPPSRGLLVSNHLSYVDIVVLSAAQPLVFVAKIELRDWPLIGWVTRCAGTVFVNRRRLRDVRRVISEIPRAAADGAVVAFFPEGTSTDGRTVMPFYPSLLEPAVRRGWPVTPVWIEYALDDGDGAAADEICWWGDADFAPHFWNFLSKRRIRARVVYGEPSPSGHDRKVLARVLHTRMCALGDVAPDPDGVALRAILINGQCPPTWRK
jgi:1-acyl-sn-glycerol-3-phosphate acyltransferase